MAFDPVGGLQMQVWRLTRQLAATGIEQTVLTSHIPGSPRRSAPFPHTTIRSVGPWLPQLLGRWFLNFAWFLGVLPELLLGIRRYDLVHVHFNHSVWCRFIVLIAAARGVPTVVSMNTALWGGLQDALDLRGKPHDIAHMIERRTLQAASRILSLTMTDASRKADEMQLDRKKFAVIPDAIELPTAGAEVGDNQTVSHFRQAFRIPADLPVVTYVGRISAEKGWEDLPALAAEDSADAAFLLVCGDGPDREKLTAALRLSARPDSWCITGFLPPEQVKTAMQVADILVLPSRREAFGGVLLEAMAAGLPAVAYAHGEIIDVADTPPAVCLVEPRNREQLAEAVRRLLHNKQARAELISLGHHRVRDFAVEHVANDILTVYRSVLVVDIATSERGPS